MKKILKLTLVIFITSLVMTGCKQSPIYNVHKHKISPHSKSRVYAAIKKAGQALGWQIYSLKSGVARGKLHLRKHVAVVNIYYNSRSYSIRYIKSKNLKYDAQKKTIHKNYNSWVQNLEKGIDARL